VIIFLKIAAIVPWIFCFIMFLESIAILTSNESNEIFGQWLLIFFAFSLVPIGLGIGSFLKANGLHKARRYEKYEREIIAIAQQNNNRITLADVTIQTTLTHQESKSFLEKMYLEGIFDIDANDKGQVEYTLR